MTAYTIPHPQTISLGVAAQKQHDEKSLRAHKLEADSYKAMMQRRRQLQASTDLATIDMLEALSPLCISVLFTLPSSLPITPNRNQNIFSNASVDH